MKNIFKIVIFFILGIVGGIFADQILWPYFVERPLFYKYRLEQSPIYVTERKEIVVQENTALISAIEKVEKAVVGIETKTPSQKTLEGSGLILTSDGLIITLSSLMPQGTITDLYIENEKTSFKVLKKDTKSNLVLIKAEKNNLLTVSFADLGKLKLGERVFLLGTEFKKESIGKIVNEGIVKNFDEESIETNISEKNTSAGSPLFDIEGNVLGLNTIDTSGKVISIPITKIKQFAGF
jgi:S1-C subfamily serine protease